MLTMKVEIEEKVDPEMEKRLRAVQRSHGAYVTIGVHAHAGRYTKGKNPPDVVEVALWNEFGTKDIPARSFVRSAVDGHSEEINRWREDAITRIVNDGWSSKRALSMLGTRIQVLIQNKIKSNVPPPNAPSVREMKRREGVPQRTLIHTMLMLRSVTFKVFTK